MKLKCATLIYENAGNQCVISVNFEQRELNINNHRDTVSMIELGLAKALEELEEKLK